MNDEIRIMIVEDQEPVREGLRVLINGSEGYRCIAACRTAEEALDCIGDELPDVVLMDINLPGMRGTECVVHIKNSHPEVQVMMLTVFENNEEIFTSLEAGATGYLLKKTPPAQLLQAISDLVKGGSPMSSEIARKVVQRFHLSSPSRFPEANLTSREEEILSYLAKGYLYKEIAASLFINIETVRTHIHKIYQKLQVRTRTEMLLKYLRQPEQ
ncbi:MAG TPA: response regulator transcription factor [Bacteroidales bacterium]|nr:response regulator transcription factor [Bacteroidales bacterium]HPT10627.1 response regulator transcription factor [Bacteroidales bacterium]